MPINGQGYHKRRYATFYLFRKNVSYMGRGTSVSAKNDIAKENGEQVYRNYIHYHTSQDLYKDTPKRVECLSKEK